MRGDEEVRRELDRAEAVPFRPEAERETGRGPGRGVAARPRVVAGAGEGPAPHLPAEEHEPGEAAGRLRAALAALLDEAAAWDPARGEAPQGGLRSAAGLGKTSALLDGLAARPGPRREVLYLVPTARLAGEVAAEARGRGLRAEVVRGREAVVGGEPLCRKHGEARIVARAGLPVSTTLCRRGTEAGETRCPFFDGCAYLAQFRTSEPALRVAAHEYLFVPMPAGLPDPGLVVVDEAFALRGARHAGFGIDRLTAPRAGMKPEHEAELHDIARAVRDRLERGEDPRGAAADADTFARMAQLETQVEEEDLVWPSMRWEEQRRRLARVRQSERHKLAAFWRALGRACGRPGPPRQVELRRDEPTGDGERRDRIHVWWRAALRVPDVPVLLLDASLDGRLARRFLPRLEVETIAARRNAEVVQVLDTACSRNRLLSFEGAAAAERARAANRLEDVRRLVEVEAAAGRRVLLVTYKAAEERLGPIPGVDVAHFGALRGLDRYKDHDTVVVAGREQPPPSAVEDLARSLFGDDGEPLDLPGGYTVATRGYRRRGGTRRGVEVSVHADPRCQAILEQVRERETEQAVDRLRLVHRERPARVVLLSNLVVDLTVDRLVAWRGLVPDRLTVAAARLGGVLPLAPAWLAGRFPDLWKTVEAARHEVKRTGSRGQTPNGDSCLGFGPLKAVDYRLVGKRGGHPTRALIRADHPSPETALGVLVGPLAMFRLEPAAAAEPSPSAAFTTPCARCGDPAEPGAGLCDVCGWLAAPPSPFPRGSSPPQRATGGTP